MRHCTGSVNKRRQIPHRDKDAAKLRISMHGTGHAGRPAASLVDIVQSVCGGYGSKEKGMTRATSLVWIPARQGGKGGESLMHGSEVGVVWCEVQCSGGLICVDAVQLLQIPAFSAGLGRYMCMKLEDRM